MRLAHFVTTVEANPRRSADAGAMARAARPVLNADRAPEIKARLRIPSRSFVEQAQRGDRRSGPFRCASRHEWCGLAARGRTVARALPASPPGGTLSGPVPDLSVVSVCLPIPVATAFTYAVTEQQRRDLVPGRRVRVPFGPRSMDGWCVGFPHAGDRDDPRPGAKPRELKAVEAVLDDGPLLDAAMMDLAHWIAETYACSWGEALSACVPAGVRSGATSATVLHARLAVPDDEALAAAGRLAAKQTKRSRILRILLEHPEGLAVRDLVRAAQCSDSPVKTLAKHGLLTITDRAIATDPFAGAAPEPPADVTLSQAQEGALAALSAAIASGGHAGFLIHGVTSSGKTEIYLRAIRTVIEAGRQAIVLVPEISLTPQTVARFRGWFERVAVLHSALTDAERRRQWHDIRGGRADVVIGPRSAIFAPVPNLGLVVLDEEHENSFKQQSAPRYHAREVALERARRASAVVVLGTATPSLESWIAAHRGPLRLLTLPARVGTGTLPKVEIIDMVRETLDTKRRDLLSRRLVQVVKRTLARKEQAILFLNRRGFATSVFCSRCGGTLRCRRCSVSVTFHRAHGTVLCHPCGEERPMPQQCPDCGGAGLARLGAGTERLEDAVRSCFPGVRFARMDSDAMHDRSSYDRVLGAFGRRELDLLLGTQMIAKGLHFPSVTAVGVVSADASLLVPYFRAAERTFQLVAQVAGRAGRSTAPGTVVVQTIQPRHPALLHAARHDFEGFAAAESAERARYHWPPHTRLVRVVVAGRSDHAARDRAQQVADELRTSLPPDAHDVLGPAHCPIERVRDRFRWQVVLRAADEPVQRAAILRLRRLSPKARGTDLTIDVDPADLT